MKVFQTLFCRLSQMALLMMLLAALGTGAMAQTCTENMDFGHSGSERYASEGSNAMAFHGSLLGYFSGKVRNGRLTKFELHMNPDVNGPDGLRAMSVNYNSSLSKTAPIFHCRNIPNGVRMTIEHVKIARQYFYAKSQHSEGEATVEIIFDRTGPGRANVRYLHSKFSKDRKPHPTPYNGLVGSAVPQGTLRLTIKNR